MCLMEPLRSITLLELCSPDGREVELMVVQNRNEGRDRGVGEDQNNEEGMIVIVIEVCPSSYWR